MKLVLMSSSNYEIGLCQACRNVRVVNNGRGSTFYLCRLAEHDSRFPKYPRLPVLACDGYEPTAASKPPSNGPPRVGNEGK
ncbi:MAG: hypothetical protein ACRENG_04355 [bacterium]